MREEAQELFQMSSNELTQNVLMIKGKRTKRSRPLSPLRLTVTSNSSCGFDNNNHFSSSSPSSSIDFAENIVGEEEDMANCLILLAQGNRKVSELDITPSPTPTTTAATTTIIKSPIINSSSAFFYQCKTCNKSFSSFQALGGHRASHKKPYMKSINSIDEHNQEIRDQRFLDSMNTTLSLQISSPMGARVSSSKNTNMIKSNKVHECSICGAEFSSGQALGGHMRRHRAALANTNSRTATPSASVVTTTSSTPEFQESKKRRISLELDLNLPAPTEENDHRESKFHFTSKEQVLVFSASSLVDCHY